MKDETILRKCQDINKEILFMNQLRLNIIKSIDDAIDSKFKEIDFLLSGKCDHGNFLFDEGGNGQCGYCKKIIPFEVIKQQYSINYGNK